MYELIKLTVNDKKSNFNMRPLIPYIAEGTHICTVDQEGNRKIKPINLIDVFRMLFLMRTSVNQEEFLFILFDFIKYVSERNLLTQFEAKLFLKELLQLKSAGLLTSHQITNILGCLQSDVIVP